MGMQQIEVVADPTCRFEDHQSTGQCHRLTDSRIQRSRDRYRQQIGQIVLAGEGQLAGFPLLRPFLQPLSKGKPLEEGANLQPENILQFETQDVQHSLVDMTDTAPHIQREDQIRQRLHQSLHLVMLALRRHEGDCFDVQHPMDTTDLRHQLLQTLEPQFGKMEIDEAPGLIQLDAAQVDGMLLQPRQQLTRQPETIFTTDL